MSEIRAGVLRKGEPRFDMAGRRLPDSLHDSDQEISAGLIHRLYRYAYARLTDIGFSLGDWKIRVYTMDGDLQRSERFYCVEFVHSKGGMIGLQGIAIGKGGWPVLDHGVCTGEGYD